MPSRAAAWGALMHGFELDGDLLQGAVGCRGLDAGDQADEAVVTPLWDGTCQQIGLDYAFGSEPADGAAQSLNGPRAAQVLP